VAQDSPGSVEAEQQDEVSESQVDDDQSDEKGEEDYLEESKVDLSSLDFRKRNSDNAPESTTVFTRTSSKEDKED
jgi:hypothetical protein